MRKHPSPLPVLSLSILDTSKCYMEICEICHDFHWQQGSDLPQTEIHSSLLVVQDINNIAISVSQAAFHLLIADCYEGTLDSFRESKRDGLVVGSLA